MPEQDENVNEMSFLVNVSSTRLTSSRVTLEAISNAVIAVVNTFEAGDEVEVLPAPHPLTCAKTMRAGKGRPQGARCEAHAVVVIDAQAGGVGACGEHLWPLLRAAQGGEETGRISAQGHRSVVVVPAHLWNASGRGNRTLS